MVGNLDLEKAYDRVNHGFLFRVLEGMGFTTVCGMDTGSICWVGHLVGFW